MDELKLIKWKENFQTIVQSLQTEYDSFFQDKKLDDLYTIKLNESHEFEITLKSELPSEIKERIEKLFLHAKPEDSI